MQISRRGVEVIVSGSVSPALTADILGFPQFFQLSVILGLTTIY
jgi:hypothetical protein